MSFSVIPTPRFKRQAKPLLKKYSSLALELEAFAQDLKNNPVQGESLGKNAYKIRISVKSKGKGKRGGLRMITDET
jgi:mRNA-degrading endonuclease RelE of RelBE toxin-antitoxin system